MTEKKLKQQFQTTAVTSGLSFLILELPIHIICDILARLPLKTIFSCRCVCKMFLKLLTDPYFVKIHLTKAPSTTTSLVVQKNLGNLQQSLYIYMLNLDEIPSTSCSSDDHYRFHPCHALTEENAEFCVGNSDFTLVGSCNGLLCLHQSSPWKCLYYIWNPILDEFVIVPYLIPSGSAYTYIHHSGFGFCQRTNQYKVIRFMCLTYFDPVTTSNLKETVAEVNTLGTESWRSIHHVPHPKTWGSFEPFLNGALHCIVDSCTSDLIYSFDLEMERFQPVSSPAHLDQDYASNISGIKVGVLGGCLCLCYVYNDAQFEVWVMKDYGVKESWIKEFVIDMKFYCGLKVADLHWPIKFLNNGDLWLICRSSSLVSYSPQKRTFRDFKALEMHNIEVSAHVPSFVSLKDYVIYGKKLKVMMGKP